MSRLSHAAGCARRAALATLAAPLALAVTLSSPVRAQAPAADAKAEVLAVVRGIFDGMRAGDSAKVRTFLHPKITLSSALERPNGPPMIQADAIDGWLKAIGTPHAEVYDERLRNPVVQIDGTLATVWVEYTFYLGSKLSHCGIDAFLMAKDATGWKVLSLADTKRRTGCPEIPAGQ